MKRGLVGFVLIGMLVTASPAKAETKRVRIPVDALPRQESSISIAAKDVVLPEGVHEGSPVPKTWRQRSDDPTPPSGHCTDGRRAAISYGDNGASTIWDLRR